MKKILLAISSSVGYMLGFIILLATMIVMVPVYLAIVVVALVIEIVFFPITIIVWMTSGFLLHRQIEKVLDKVNQYVEKNNEKKHEE